MSDSAQQEVRLAFPPDATLMKLDIYKCIHRLHVSAGAGLPGKKKCEKCIFVTMQMLEGVWADKPKMSFIKIVKELPEDSVSEPIWLLLGVNVTTKVLIERFRELVV